MKEYVRNNARVLSILFGILGVLGLIVYSFVAPGGMFSGLQNDLKMIEVEESVRYTTLDGAPIDLEDLKGKPIIINSWATWMPFSKDELPLLIALNEEYGDQIEIIAMNRMENVLTVRSYLGTYGIPESIKFLLDPADSFYRAVGGYAMPETLFYREDGTLLVHKRGTLTEDELRNYAATLIE